MSFVYSDSLVGSECGIRLLILLPCEERGAPIECRLETVDLSANTKFEALSYVWGDPSIRVDIFVNNHVLNVTANLGTALRHLRHKKNPRALWVDAVCIDQTSLEERNHQVRRMRHIYQHASHTIVWLGEGDEETDMAMSMLRKIDQQEDPHPFKYISQELAREDLLAAKPGLEKIAARPWWTRMWTFQEFIVARSINVLCGEMCVSWKPFDMLLPWAGALNMSHRTEVIPQSFSVCVGVRNFRNVWHSRIRDSGTFHLSSLLNVSSDRGAGEPRDHVFALLGLVLEGTRKVEVDYKSPLTSVYHDATVAAFEEAGEDVLFKAIGLKKVPGLASWAIDFSDPRWYAFQPLEGLTMGPINKSWLSTPHPAHHKWQCEYDSESGILGLQGYSIDEVKAVMHLSFPEGWARGIPAYYGADESCTEATKPDLVWMYHEYLSFRRKARSCLERRLGPLAAHENIRGGAIWKMMAPGRSFRALAVPAIEHGRRHDGLPKNQSPEPATVPNNFDFLDEWLSGGDLLRRPYTALPSVLAELERNMVYIASAWFRTAAVCTLFVTENGYIGRSRRPVQLDDFVCVFDGMTFPAVLRPSDGGRYRLHSFALVQGLMSEKPDNKELTMIDDAVGPSSQLVRFDNDGKDGGRMNGETDRWSMELLPLVGFPLRRFDLI